jgi:hypothetical protein
MTRIKPTNQPINQPAQAFVSSFSSGETRDNAHGILRPYTAYHTRAQSSGPLTSIPCLSLLFPQFQHHPTIMRLPSTLRLRRLPNSPSSSFATLSTRSRGLATLRPRPAGFAQFLKISDEVKNALNAGQPVVALESAIYTHGELFSSFSLPHPWL